MKVRDLLVALQDFNPDSQVGVSCEIAGDPHPVISVGMDRGLIRFGIDTGEDWDGEVREFIGIGARHD